jgi:hypothetical protein
LLDVPGYRFQALMTSLPAATHPPRAVWRYYPGRADGEKVIKDLHEGLALPTLCLESFGASEAALSLATLTCHLTVLFPRHLGWQRKVTIGSLRFWLFVTAGVLSHPGGQDHHQTGRARAGTRLVATPMGEDFEPDPQLQCSRKPPGHKWIPMFGPRNAECKLGLAEEFSES